MMRTLAIIGAAHLATSILAFGLGLSGRLDDRTCVTPIAEIGRSFRHGYVGVRK